MKNKIKVVQALLTLGEGGAQTYFEKMVYAFQDDPEIDQRVITVSLSNRLKRFDNAGINYLATGNFRSDKAPHRFVQSLFAKYNDRRRIKGYLDDFQPQIIVSYHNTAPEIIHYPSAVHIARMGHGNSKKTYANCDFIVVNQPTLRHQILAKGWSKKRIEVISNFAEFPEALQSSGDMPELPAGARVLLTLGRLHPAKAQDTLIEAMTLLPDNTCLLIAGAGRLEMQLKMLTDSLNLSQRVFFLGLRRDVPALLKMADIVLLPSRYEPLGNVILEAWQARKPIIAANSDGPRWLIEDGKNGLLFNIDDVKSCADQIKYLLDMPNTQLQEMLNAGSEKLQEYFSKEVIVGQYKTLFRKLIDSRLT